MDFFLQLEILDTEWFGQKVRNLLHHRAGRPVTPFGGALIFGRHLFDCFFFDGRYAWCLRRPFLPLPQFAVVGFARIFAGVMSLRLLVERGSRILLYGRTSWKKASSR